MLSTPVNAQGGSTGTTIDILNVRRGPGLEYAVIGALSIRAEVMIEGRNRVGDWVLTHTPDGRTRGWVKIKYLNVSKDFNLAALPVSQETIQATAAPAVGSGPAGSANEAALMAVPIVPTVTANTRTIYQRGQRAGNRPNVFAKVGDCNTEAYPFLSPLDFGLVNLGPYSNLQSTVRYFAGSYARQSAAGRTGYNSLTVLDAVWADPNLCQAGESSLYCEYRRLRPSVAIIMFGANDVKNLTVQQFQQAMRRILDLSVRMGIIPVLTTFTGAQSDALLQYNMILVNLAREYNIPIINFWRAARTLPSSGLGADGLHLSYSGSPQVSFNGEEKSYGFSLRNLVTLQTLDVLRRAVFG